MEVFGVVAGGVTVVGFALALWWRFKDRRHALTATAPASRVADASSLIRINLPPRKLFVGRNSLLLKMEAVLKSAGEVYVTQTIVGLGGVGKTQLAIEYAHRHLDQYTLIAWLRAGDEESLLIDLSDLARALGLQRVEGIPPDQMIAAVHARLSERDKWLLVFDNAQGSEALRPYLPPAGKGHVLITSRNPNWRARGEPIDVNPFQRDESIEFLLLRSGYDDKDGADQVSEALGDLPLALEQAGAYVEQTPNIDLKSYAGLFAKRHEDLWRSQSPPDNYHATVATTWSLAMDMLSKDSPASADLVRLISFLAADDIPLFLLSEGAETLPEPLRSAAADEVRLGETVGALRKHSLVQVVERDRISVHRLVQTVVRDGMKREEQDRWIETTLNLLRRVHDYRQDQPETWKRCERLLPHVAMAVAFAEERGLTQEAACYLLNDAGSCLRTLANFPLAKSYLERALRIGVAVYGPDHPITAALVNGLGLVLRDLGQLAEAKAALERALRISEAVYGPNHPSVAIRFNNLGGVLQDLGQLAEAKAAYERALRIGEVAYGPDHPTVATTVNNLGEVLRDLGKLAEARAAFERALRIDEKLYGPDHPAVASDVSNLGLVLHALGQLAEAKAAYERALRIDEAVYGPDHPTVAIRVNNLGGLLQAMGQPLEAKAAIERALRIDERVYGPDHPGIAPAVNNLGGVLRGLGQLTEAKAAYERALRIVEAAYGPDHPTVAKAVNNLGVILHDLGQVAEAKAAFERALRIDEKILGYDHPTTNAIRSRLQRLRPNG